MDKENSGCYRKQQQSFNSRALPAVLNHYESTSTETLVCITPETKPFAETETRTLHEGVVQFFLSFISSSDASSWTEEIMSSEGVNDDCLGWAARDASGILSPYKFSRRAVGNDDVYIKITYCGLCYADVIWTGNKHHDSKYPVVPGHEIAGIVEKAGSKVQRFKVGNHVGVGTYVNSCRDCEYCNDRLEVNCLKGSVYTFNGVDVDGTITKGGYSSYIVVHERYCFKIPKNYPLASAAPLFCAGITVYTPMMRHKMNQPGKSLGVIGLGGLGHMAVKFGKHLG